jgi:uncharacterized Zn-finger protein
MPTGIMHRKIDYLKEASEVVCPYCGSIDIYISDLELICNTCDKLIKKLCEGARDPWK